MKINAEEVFWNQNLLLNAQCSYHDEIQVHLSVSTK